MPAMEMTRRDLLRYAAAGSVVLALAACGPKEPQAPAAESEAPQPAAEERPAEAKPAGDKVVITQWYHEYGEAGCQEAAYRIAEEYSNSQDKVTVEVGWFPGDYVPKLNTALAAGDAPDCFEHHLEVDYVRTGVVAPMDELLDPETKADYLEGVMEKLCSIKGTVYALPVAVDFQGMYCNDKLLKEAGIDPDHDAWDWHKIFDAAEKLTKDRMKGLFLGNEGGHGCIGNYGVHNTGRWLLDPETLEFDFNNDTIYQLFDEFREYQKKGTLLQGSPMDWWDPSAINQGLCAMQWGGFWQMPGTAAVLGEDFSFSVFPPHPAGGDKARYYTELGGWVGSVYSKSANLELALEYTKWQWIDNIDWQNEWSTAYGFHIPARKSAAAANAKLQTGPGAKAVEQVNKYGFALHKLWSGPVPTPYNDALTEIFKNNADIKSQLEKTAELCQKELDSQRAFWEELPG